MLQRLPHLADVVYKATTERLQTYVTSNTKLTQYICFYFLSIVLYLFGYYLNAFVSCRCDLGTELSFTDIQTILPIFVRRLTVQTACLLLAACGMLMNNMYDNDDISRSVSFSLWFFVPLNVRSFSRFSFSPSFLLVLRLQQQQHHSHQNKNKTNNKYRQQQPAGVLSPPTQLHAIAGSSKNWTHTLPHVTSDWCSRRCWMQVSMSL